LSARIGSCASVGYPGEKYATGLEAIEQIELTAAHVACRVFGASYTEVRDVTHHASGASKLDELIEPNWVSADVRED
jgi:glycine/serine hydroxymethyltransferase